jgi:hypothetical protein
MVAAIHAAHYRYGNPPSIFGTGDCGKILIHVNAVFQLCKGEPIKIRLTKNALVKPEIKS